jgi:hypothetical protein
MDEILNENLESEIPVEETEIESEISNEILNERVNPFCVISKNTFGEYAVRDIQTNSSWSANPYGEDYAVVPDDMVLEITETKGFCDIVLNEDGTEVASFTAREIPEIPEAPHEPTAEERIAELEAQNADSVEIEADLMYELALIQLGLI